MTVLDNLCSAHVHMKTGVLGAFAYWGFAQKEELRTASASRTSFDFLSIQDRAGPTGPWLTACRSASSSDGRWRSTRRSCSSRAVGGCNHGRKRGHGALLLDVTRSGASP